MKTTVKKYIKLLILITLLLGLSMYAAYIFGFVKDYPDPDELPQEYLFALFIDNENLSLRLKTEQAYSSGCFIKIYLEENIESEYVEIQIRDVNTVPLDNVACPEFLVEPYQAEASVDLGKIRTMELTFSLGSKKDVYKVNVDDGTILVASHSSDFTTYIENSEF